MAENENGTETVVEPVVLSYTDPAPVLLDEQGEPIENEQGEWVEAPHIRTASVECGEGREWRGWFREASIAKDAKGETIVVLTSAGTTATIRKPGYKDLVKAPSLSVAESRDFLASIGGEPGLVGWNSAARADARARRVTRLSFGAGSGDAEVYTEAELALLA